MLFYSNTASYRNFFNKHTLRKEVNAFYFNTVNLHFFTTYLLTFTDIFITL
jgi:hypothetical protein